MLIEKSLSAHDVVSMKLASGEEIIAKVLEINADHLIVTKPVTLVMAQMQGGQGMVAMAPFMLGINEDAKLRFDFTKLITYAKARADAAGQYLQATSGIAIPQPGAGLAGLGGLGGTAGPASTLPTLRGSKG